MADNPAPIEVQKFLSGVDYPAERDDLVQAAEEEGADEKILDLLRGLPERSFEKPTEVSSALSDQG